MPWFAVDPPQQTPVSLALARAIAAVCGRLSSSISWLYLILDLFIDPCCRSPQTLASHGLAALKAISLTRLYSAGSASTAD
jgi:hypothetical protein